MSAFKRYVEVGRVVVLSDGQDKGKLAVITEIIDHNRAIIDGPSTGVARQSLRYRHMSLTPIVIKELPRAAGTKTVKKYFESTKVAEKWAESTWAKKLAARQTKAKMTDFDRFNVSLLKKERRRLVGTQLKKSKAKA